MKTIKTIHVFNFGKTQVIGKELNKTFDSTELNTLEAFINHVKSKKPEGQEDSDFHAINIFRDMFVDYLPKETGVKNYRVKYSEIDEELINSFISELEEKVNDVEESEEN